VQVEQLIWLLGLYRVVNAMDPFKLGISNLDHLHLSIEINKVAKEVIALLDEDHLFVAQLLRTNALLEGSAVLLVWAYLFNLDTCASKGFLEYNVALIHERLESYRGLVYSQAFS